MRTSLYRKVTLKNFKELRDSYFAIADITEIRFASSNFPSYEDWLKFAEANHNLVSMWRKELELKLKQEAMNTVITTMRSNPKEALSAAKFLLQKGVLSRDGTDMVTKEEVAHETKKNNLKQADKDYLRLVKNSD